MRAIFSFLLGGSFIFSGWVYGAALTVSNAEVPFGDLVSEQIYHYNRQTPQIATAGRLNPSAAVELTALGFKMILDLRLPDEGVADERARLESRNLHYYNLPIGYVWPNAQQLSIFKTMVEDQKNYPLLIHCMSGNRVGFLWAIYQVQSRHTSLEAAILQGKTIGLKPDLENLLRKNLH